VTPVEDEQQLYGGTQSALSTTLLLWVAVGKRVASGAARTMPVWRPISSNVIVSRRF
jgi:hypothetical protein